MEPYAAGLPLGRLVAVFYTVTEGLSILENLSRAGVPIPQQLRDALEKLSAEKDVGQRVTAARPVQRNSKAMTRLSNARWDRAAR